MRTGQGLGEVIFEPGADIGHTHQSRYRIESELYSWGLTRVGRKVVEGSRLTSAANANDRERCCFGTIVEFPSWKALTRN